MIRPESEFLQWIHDRLEFIYGENRLYDYMWTLREVIAAAKKREKLVGTMVKTISNVEWMKLVLKEHQPVPYDIGTQRDPEEIIVCTHMDYKERLQFAKAPGFKFTTHILDLIEKEFPGTLMERGS